MNPNIEPVYWWLTAITLPLWLIAAVCNLHAARFGVREGVKLRAATAMLALIYLSANVVLLFSHVHPGDWSDVARGLTAVSVPVVWIWPACLSLRMAESIRDAERRAREREV